MTVKVNVVVASSWLNPVAGPVKNGCVVPSGSERFIRQAMRPSSARDSRSSASALRAPWRVSSVD